MKPRNEKESTAHEVEQRSPLSREDQQLLLAYVVAESARRALNFGRTVRHLRQRRRLSRKDLARLARVPGTWLITLERGRIPFLSFVRLHRLAKALGTTEIALLNGMDREIRGRT